MSNNKKILSVLMALIMALSVFTSVPLSVSAGGIDTEPGYPGYVCSGETDDYQYGVYNQFNGYAQYKVSKISAYIGSETDIVIPDTLGGYPVVGIGYAFSGRTELTSVTIPNSVRNIGYRAFFGCTGLTSVTLPDSGCDIDIEAFSGCTGLTSITLPDSAWIGPGAFSYCTGLTSLHIPASVTSLYEYDKDLSDYVTPFSGCSGLRSITVDENNPVYDSRDNCNAIIETDTNKLIFGCKNTVIPASVTEIGGYAFEACTSLSKVTIPASVTVIDDCVFNGCSDDFTIYGYTGSYAQEYAEANDYNFVSIGTVETNDYEYTITDGQAVVIGYTGNETNLEIPSEFGGCPVTSIGDSAFYGCTELNSVTIPDSVITIGDSAFFNCTGLTSVTIPESVKSIGFYAFGYALAGHGEVLIDDFTICGYIGSEAHDYAYDNGVAFVRIGIEEPSNEYNDQDYTYTKTENGEATILRYNGSEKNIVIPDTLGGCPVTAVKGLFSIRSYYDLPEGPITIVIPESVKYIGREYAEIGARIGSLCDITILSRDCEIAFLYDFRDDYNVRYTVVRGYRGSTAEAYDDHPINFIPLDEEREEDPDFDYYTYGGRACVTRYKGSAENVVVPNELDGYPVSELGYQYREEEGGMYEIRPHGTFENTAVQSVVLPDTVQKIGARAFYGCEALTTVKLPSSLQVIDNYAFSGCKVLTSVTIPNSVTSIGDNAFEDCSGLEKAVVPEQISYNVLYKAMLGIKPVYMTNGWNEWFEVKKYPDSKLTIYGYYGTDAEKYAAEFEIPFRMIAPATSDEVSVDAPEGYTFSVVQKSTEDQASPDEQAPVENQPLPEGSILLGVYDITLRSAEDESPVQPGAPVTVRIRCDNPDAHVFRREADGSLTDMNARYEDGYLIFEADHFSIYLVVELGAEVDLALCGDADGDGNVTSLDVTTIQRVCASMKVDVSPDQLMNADVNGDGEVDIIDVTYIQRYLANIAIPYPIGERV